MPTLDSSSSGINFANVEVELLCKAFKLEYDSSKKAPLANKQNNTLDVTSASAGPLSLRRFSELQKSQRKKQQLPAQVSSGGGDHLLLTQEVLVKMVQAARHNSQEGEYMKKILRQNTWSPFFSPLRKYLWKCLTMASQVSATSVSFGNKENQQNQQELEMSWLNEYNSDLNQIFGKSRDIDASLPDFANVSKISSSSFVGNSSLNSSTTGGGAVATMSSSHLNYYFLNSQGKQAIKRILSVYEYHYPHVTFSPSLVSIASLLLHYMQEHEVFAALSFMASTHEHIIESKAAWETTCSVFAKLLKSYCKSSYEILVKHATDQVDSILSDWYWWIFDNLSFEYLVKIMDCFLFEGQKVLFRVALAIMQHYCKKVKVEHLKITRDSIRLFCGSPSSFESVDALLKASFSIRNLKRSTIKEFYQKEEKQRKALGGSIHSSPGKGTLNVNASLHTTTDNNNNFVNASKTNSLRIDTSVGGGGDPSQSSPSRIFLSETSTSILSHANLLTIWHWIPPRLSTYTPQMCFTTQEHGTSLNTLYNVLDELEYCLIVVKTFQNEIFGAFCSCSWLERKEKKLYFGNGETFLFKLMPEKKVFRWVGIRTPKVDLNQELFIRADSTKIAIGGGGNEGLSIKSNLIEGQSNRCDTFDNEPLSSSQTFDIQILEVVAFSSSQH